MDFRGEDAIDVRLVLELNQVVSNEPGRVKHTMNRPESCTRRVDDLAHGLQVRHIRRPKHDLPAGLL